MAEEQKALDEVLGSPAADAPKEQPVKEPSQPEDGEKESLEKKEEVPEEPKAEPEKKDEKAAEKKPEPAGNGRQDGKKDRKAIGKNVVLVGKKPTMSYVLAAVTQFSDGLSEIHIKARGRNISRAVDVAEVVRKRFVQDAKTIVNIDTQEIRDENNNRINVSTIDIMLGK
jgi:archaea-specific DNA-binding protein